MLKTNMFYILYTDFFVVVVAWANQSQCFMHTQHVFCAEQHQQTNILIYMSILASKMVFSVSLNFHNIIYTPDNLQISRESLSNLCVLFIEPLAIYCPVYYSFERRSHFFGGGARKYKHIMKMTRFSLFLIGKRQIYVPSLCL